MFFSQNMRLYLLSLAYPNHPRFKARARQAQQVHFWKTAGSNNTATLDEVTLVMEHATANKSTYFQVVLALAPLLKRNKDSGATPTKKIKPSQ